MGLPPDLFGRELEDRDVGRERDARDGEQQDLRELVGSQVIEQVGQHGATPDRTGSCC